MKCLVTGGSGFIGSHLVDRLINDGHNVIVIDNESSISNNVFYKNKKAKYYNLDVSDYNSTKKLYNGVDFVFHLAAESRIQPTLNNPRLAFTTNVIGTQTVLQCSVENNVKRVIYSSTSSAYGLVNLVPLIEDMPNDCLNPYSVSKTAGEEICKMYTRLYKLPTTIFRYFNVYGEREPLKGVYAPVLGLFLEQKKRGEQLTIVGDGLQTRDFTHVNDVVNANILAMKIDKKLNGEIINIGSGKNVSILDLAKKISNDYIFIEKRLGEAQDTLANIEKAKKLLKWKPKENLDDYLIQKLRVKK